MKKLLILTVALLTIFTLASCGKNKYEPVESTEEESRTVMTLSYGGKSFDVKYELYRMIFLTNRELVDGGDVSVWSSADKDEYVKKMDAIILDYVTEIYSALYLAQTIGIDPYSKDMDETVSEYVRISVEGNGTDISGHGSYEAFLASLKEMNMNYSVQDLLLRYATVKEKIYEYYGGETDAVLGDMKGELVYTREDVREYYESDDSARVLQLFFAANVKDMQNMQSYRAALTERAGNDESVAAYIINRCPIALSGDILDENDEVVGITVGKHELDSLRYANYTEAALALQAGELSEIIEVMQDEKYYYILYALEKTDGYFEDHYDRIEKSYVDHAIGKKLYDVKSALTQSATYSAVYSDISHGDISMN